MRDLKSHGFFLSGYSTYFAIHDGYLKKHSELIREFRRLKDEDDIFFILRSKVGIAHNDTIICACMAIEGFLNFYGVRRTYGNWYKENLERVGITEKLSIISALYFDDYDSNVLVRLRRNVRKLFDKRNAIVHVKSKSVTSDDFPYLLKNDMIDMSKFSSRLLIDFKNYFKCKDSNISDLYFR